MLLSAPPPEDLFEKTCHFADSGAYSRETLVHPTRVIQFLVGVRGKNETMAIGGPWYDSFTYPILLDFTDCFLLLCRSPSLDGPDPEGDPSVLVRTAIRACRALTGVDLSGCTQWHRFLEIHYRRQETSSRPARTETTVIFLPDVWSVMPTRAEYIDTEAR